MTFDQGSLGDLASLATALGLLGPDNQVSTAFFADPASAMAGMLRDATRRQALLDFLDQALGQGASPITEGNATWTPVLNVTDAVDLYLVVAPSVADPGGTVFGVGVRAATNGTPGAEGRLSVPIVLVPAGPQSVTFLPGSSSADAVASLTAQVDVASASLQSAGLSLQVPLGTGATPGLTVDVHGLVLPGTSAPIDLSLNGSQPFGQELAHALTALVTAQLTAAAGSLAADDAALLAVLGLDPKAPVPLPIAEIAVSGLSAVQDWLSAFAKDPAALQHWVSNLATLTGGSAAGTSPTASWTLGPGLSATLGLTVTADAVGGTTLSLVAGAVATLGGSPAASLDLSATLLEATVGPHPSVTALPALTAFARYAGSPLVNVIEAGTALVVGGLRAGVALDEERRVVLVLAADEVDIGAPGSTTHHDTLDLTSPDALAEIGGQALSGLAGNVLSGLGARAAAVSELVGLTPPSGAAAGWPAFNPATFLADPVAAIASYHGSVLALGAGEYARLLGSVVSLFGKSGPVSGSGAADDPWASYSAGDVQLVLWAVPSTSPASAALHIGARWSPAPASLGRPGPTMSLALLVDAVEVPLAAPAGLSVLPAIQLVAAISSAGGTPLTLGIEGGSVQVPSASLTCVWAPKEGLSATLGVTGAEVTVAGITHPLALPVLGTGGTVSVPAALGAPVIETLVAAWLQASANPWLKSLPAVFGLGQGAPAAGAQLASPAAVVPPSPVASGTASMIASAGPTTAAMTAAQPTAAMTAVQPGAAPSAPAPGALTDPIGWLAARLRNQIAAEGGAALQALATTVATLVQGAAPTSLAGTGTPDDPYRVSLGTAGAVSLEVSLWLDPAGPPVPEATRAKLLAPTELSGWLDGGAALTTAQLAALLASAASAVPTLADLLAGRDAIAAGWDALIARCVGGDGLLPGGAADTAGATAHAVPGVPNSLLPGALKLSALSLPAHDLVLYVTGPYTPAWPGKLTTIDLTIPGLAATAFDVSAVTTHGTTSVHVRLPSRSVCPGTDAASRAQAQADRLARVVVACAPRRVLMVAHGAAGGAARAVAGGGAPVIGLVMLGPRRRRCPWTCSTCPRPPTLWPFCNPCSPDLRAAAQSPPTSPLPEPSSTCSANCSLPPSTPTWTWPHRPGRVCRRSLSSRCGATSTPPPSPAPSPRWSRPDWAPMPPRRRHPRRRRCAPGLLPAPRTRRRRLRPGRRGQRRYQLHRRLHGACSHGRPARTGCGDQCRSGGLPCRRVALRWPAGLQPDPRSQPHARVAPRPIERQLRPERLGGDRLGRDQPHRGQCSRHDGGGLDRRLGPSPHPGGSYPARPRGRLARPVTGDWAGPGTGRPAWRARPYRPDHSQAPSGPVSRCRPAPVARPGR